jgi:periplasmic divalent cation tolerance protein
MDRIMVVSTADSLELAQNIASALVEAHEAACVNIIPNIKSVYRWEGEVCDDEEFLLLIKSSAERFEAVRDRIRLLHTYEVPEVIALQIKSGDPDYFRWLDSSVAGQNGD